MTFSSWWRRPLTAGGTDARFVDGVVFPNWLSNASARILHRVFRSIPGTDRRWADSFRNSTTRPMLKMDSRLTLNLKHASHHFAHSLMLGLASSPSRVRFAALKNPRALDRSGRQT